MSLVNKKSFFGEDFRDIGSMSILFDGFKFDSSFLSNGFKGENFSKVLLFLGVQLTVTLYFDILLLFNTLTTLL